MTSVLTVTDDDGATDTGRAHGHRRVRRTPLADRLRGQATSNANNVAFNVRVPAHVEADDALLLFASQGSSAVLTGPGTGWTQVGRVVDSTMRQPCGVAGDVLGCGQQRSAEEWERRTPRSALTLAAYRGVDPSSPLVSATGAAEPGTTASHKTPVVSNSATGAWRVSYWSDKNSATTSWTAPAGEANRATTAGSGGGPGRIPAHRPRRRADRRHPGDAPAG